MQNFEYIVLYGTGRYAQDAWFHYTYFLRQTIAYVYDDYNCVGAEWHRIPVITHDKYANILRESLVIVAVEDAGLRDTIVSDIRAHGGAVSAYLPSNRLPNLSVHCNGIYPDIVFEGNTLHKEGKWDFTYRARCTADMMLHAMELYAGDFTGKKIDFWYTIHDQGETEGLFSMTDRYFAYCTTYVFKDKIIPIPDHKSYFNKNTYPDPETEEACRAAALKPWEDKRAFWVGTPGTNRSRKMLVELGRQYPEFLDIRVHDNWKQQFKEDGSNDFIPMLEWARYKYLIDAPGIAWTDRTKIMLRLGRPVLLIDRMDREWYFDKLQPMVHYVPVKADLSDLMEKLELLENDEVLYEEIAKNAMRFADEYLSCDAVNAYVKEMLLKYGVVD